MVPGTTADRQVAAIRQPLGFRSVSLVLLTVLLWGGTPVATKFSLETMPPIAVACVRFGLASVCMLIWCLITGVLLRPRGHEVVLAGVAGGIMALQIFLFNLGIHYSNASHGTVLIQTFVFMVLVIEHFFTKTDRLTARTLLGVTISAVGVAAALATTGQMDAIGSAGADELLQHHSDRPRLLGDGLLLLSAGLLSIKIVFIKFSVQQMDSAKLIFWHDLVGLLFFGLFSLVLEGTAAWALENFTWPTILGLLYQGIVVAGFCFASHAWLLQYHSATQLSVFSFATPLFGVMLAVVLRRDPLSSWIVVAGIGVAVGIYLVNQRHTKPATTG